MGSETNFHLVDCLRNQGDVYSSSLGDLLLVRAQYLLILIFLMMFFMLLVY